VPTGAQQGTGEGGGCDRWRPLTEEPECGLDHTLQKCTFRFTRTAQLSSSVPTFTNGAQQPRCADTSGGSSDLHLASTVGDVRGDLAGEPKALYFGWSKAGAGCSRLSGIHTQSTFRSPDRLDSLAIPIHIPWICSDKVVTQATVIEVVPTVRGLGAQRAPS